MRVEYVCNFFVLIDIIPSNLLVFFRGEFDDEIISSPYLTHYENQINRKQT